MWNKLTQPGIISELHMQSVKRIKLVNRLSLALASLALLSGMFLLYMGSYTQALILAGFLLCIIIVLILNHYKRYLSARLLIVAVINFTLFYFALTLGKDCGIHLVFFYAAIVSWLIFSTKQAIYSVCASVLSLTLFLYIVFGTYTAAIVIKNVSADFFFAFAAVLTFALLVTTMLLFRNDTYRTEQFLGSTNSILKETKTKLQHTLTENEAVVAFSQVMYSNGESIEALCRAGLQKIKDIAPYTYGAVLLYEKDTDTLKIQEEVGYDANARRVQTFRNGESLTGDAFQRQKVIRIHDAPGNYWHATSGLGKVIPAELIIMPMTFKAKTGILEMAFMKPPGDNTMAILQRISVAFAANLLAMMSNAENIKLVSILQQQKDDLSKQLHAAEQNIQK